MKALATWSLIGQSDSRGSVAKVAVFRMSEKRLMAQRSRYRGILTSLVSYWYLHLIFPLPPPLLISPGNPRATPRKNKDLHPLALTHLIHTSRLPASPSPSPSPMSAPADDPPILCCGNRLLHSTSAKPQSSSHLQVPQAKNGIPRSSPSARWKIYRDHSQRAGCDIRCKESHQFFVNTKEDPPSPTGSTLLDIPEILNSLSSEARRGYRTREQAPKANITSLPIIPKTNPTTTEPAFPPRLWTQTRYEEVVWRAVQGQSHRHEAIKNESRIDRSALARNKNTDERSTRELRQAMQRAQMTGQPQFFAKDKNGRNVYIELPGGPGMGYGGITGDMVSTLIPMDAYTPTRMPDSSDLGIPTTDPMVLMVVVVTACLLPVVSLVVSWSVVCCSNRPVAMLPSSKLGKGRN